MISKGRPPKLEDGVDNGLILDISKPIFCISCGKNKLNNQFYRSKNFRYNKLNLIIFCVSCIDKFYQNYLKRADEDEAYAMYLLCRKLDIPFVRKFWDSIETKKIPKYQSYVNTIYSSNNEKYVKKKGSFDDGDEFEKGRKKTIADVPKNVKLFWGSGHDPEDYTFLEKEMSEWKKSCKCDNRAEEILLKEICLTILELNKMRLEDKGILDIDKTQKSLQALMKTANYDPSKAVAANSGKAVDKFGSWVKDIEEHEPAEYFKDKSIYKDIDDIEGFAKKYIFRPIKNLLTGSRDFDIGSDSDGFV